MPVVACPCGAKLRVADTLIGKLVKCPKCASPVRVTSEAVPAAEPELDLMPEAPVPAAAPRTFAPPPPKRLPPPPPSVPAWKVYGRWALGLALLPLILSLFTKDEPMARLNRMLESDPKLATTIEKAEKKGLKEEEFFALLPGERIDGAFVAHSSKIHWLFALIAAGAFGIVLLLGLQMAAEFSQGMWLHGRSIIVIFFYIVKFIGFSYRAALDPENGFILSMIGYTFGVGFCEEICKLLPGLWHFKRTAKLDLSGAVVWGLASGIGFGVSEGIMYSSEHYNGITQGGIYLVRFVSCVALHAIWSGFSSVLLWKWQTELDEIGSWYGWFIPLFKMAGVSMLLHGFYDTALKKDHEFLALLAALISFAAFFWLYERVKKDEPAMTRTVAV